MSDAVTKSKLANKPQENGGKKTPGKKPQATGPAKQQQQKQQQQQEKSEPTTEIKSVVANVNDDNVNDDSDSVAVENLLKSHEKELLQVASELLMENRHYDIELRQLSSKLEIASRRLIQLENRFPTVSLWHIRNFNDLFQEARCSPKSWLTSPEYYVSRQGYRIAMSANLYGDGAARGSSVSLFVNICKGEFDGSLSWPFALRVSLSIMDQTEDEAPRRNLTRVIVPAVGQETRAFLERPQRDKNPKFGFEKFASLEDLLHGDRKYVLNDAMFIKLEVPRGDLKAV